MTFACLRPIARHVYLLLALLLGMSGWQAGEALAAGNTLTTGWDGAGSVQLSPAGGVYPRWASVTVTARPDPGWAFDHWGGDLQSTSNPLTVRMRKNLDVVAFFRCVSCGGVTGPYLAEKVYVGRNEYIEYIAGDLPVILSAPHGGYLMPEEIPDRTSGTTTGDAWTQELIRLLQSTFRASLGGTPHIVINRLDRRKLDANRDLEEAAEGDPEATQAWYEFHSFLESAALEVVRTHGAGIYIDLHGQSDDPARAQLGYLLYSDELMMSNSELDASGLEAETSIRSLAGNVDVPFSALLRGTDSLGGLLELAGFPSVPSPANPDPGRSVYYSGGYNTVTHGSLGGGSIDGIQIESNMAVREDESVRTDFAEALAEAVSLFLRTHYAL